MADPKVQVKHVLNTLEGIKSWIGHVHAALSSLDPELELDVKSGPLLGNGPRRTVGVCPPPENGPRRTVGACPPPESGPHGG